MNKRILALIAAFIASAIYGINHTLAKGVMPTYVQPYGFILIRVLGAAILFWGISFWGPKEKIAKSDWPRIIGCAILGMVINMQVFFKGLSLSTPIHSSLIITVTPILVFVLSALLIGEKLSWLRAFGILLGFAGTAGLILYDNTTAENAPNIPLGNLLFVINATSYGLYLILVKPLTNKYHAFTLMKWLFLIAVFINFPISYVEFSQVQWQELPVDIVLKIIYVVLGTTFATYLLNIFAIKTLKASTIGAFIYLQPLIGILFAVVVGADQLNLMKVATAAMIFTGVYLVTKKTEKSV
ncbi:Permease of the drug/metabolite transporter (DMT) superfamily [Zhouia amylolytica]|uniref:Permease of the drug/metabolite transporter (DMT) superfamily n=1 Tax=Zhouia amylolytica TaxID=376730 RepID=A0A1I6SN12_9FLAO|nr:DMT family transporter [Zhouia amylolytica]MCQ0111553.1 DMT family transporter [Zhouia amylolytica]SFS78355.1 Permease of the drug/metabolite transporter (DMT) superfamily [Zhouia amylolytica]